MEGINPDAQITRAGTTEPVVGSSGNTAVTPNAPGVDGGSTLRPMDAGGPLGITTLL